MCVAAACSASGSRTPVGATGPTATSAATAASGASTTPAPPTTVARPVDQAGWTIESVVDGKIAVDGRTVSESDGSTVTLVRFRAGVTRFELHVGSVDPPVAAGQLPSSAGPAITATERPHLVAAFNGGFKRSAGVGGFEVDSKVIEPLRSGDTSLAVGPAGTARIGVWGHGFPPAGASVSGVLQNLPPLILAGHASDQINDPAAWGATLGGGSVVARSALGEDPNGDLVYAASMHALPVDLASALVSVGSTVAMELDINPEWVQADVSSAPGGALTAQVPGQTRPPGQYLDGWTHDFVAVLAGP
jgi:hypothetical protein